jgi:hypothetical protein
VDFDASVSKDFALYERLKFQFRVDAFNFINHTNLQSPSTTESPRCNYPHASSSKPSMNGVGICAKRSGHANGGRSMTYFPQILRKAAAHRSSRKLY